MGKYCKHCKKFMKDPTMTHCSDACLLTLITNSQTLDDFGRGALYWDDKSDPWT